MSASIAIGGAQQIDSQPLRQAVPATVRAVDQKNPPAVAAATGLGGGGGAGILNQGADADASQGLVRLAVGSAPGATGSLTLQFPQATPAAAGGMFCAADWASLSVTQGNPLTIAWTATRPLAKGEVVIIAYQWRNMV